MLCGGRALRRFPALIERPSRSISSPCHPTFFIQEHALFRVASAILSAQWPLQQVPYAGSLHDGFSSPGQLSTLTLPPLVGGKTSSDHLLLN